MERISTQGAIYKLIKYTDSSAIALAYTKEFGKIKLFMPKAYSGKSGVLSLIPGEIDFLKKDNSDLNRLYNFRPDPAFMSFVNEPILSLRLILVYDIFDNLYEVEQKEPILWSLITRFDKNNASSVFIFSLYALLKNSGNMFSCDFCPTCGKEVRGEAALFSGFYYCSNCAPEGSLLIGSDEDLILRSLSKPKLYKNIKISLHQELKVAEILVNHTEAAIGKNVKSFNTFKTLITSL
ncbi:MAG: recombination protein O N-terminal domain-containing protein [Deferribacterales bacterium]|nr:recombination protein O N-terminal domain-containing protein [Deferribacterales bacterium]